MKNTLFPNKNSNAYKIIDAHFLPCLTNKPIMCNGSFIFCKQALYNINSLRNNASLLFCEVI